jgi:hypothetical protein
MSRITVLDACKHYDDNFGTDLEGTYLAEQIAVFVQAKHINPKLLIKTLAEELHNYDDGPGRGQEGWEALLTAIWQKYAEKLQCNQDKSAVSLNN